MHPNLYSEISLIGDGDEVHDGGGAEPDVHAQPHPAPRMTEYPVLVRYEYTLWKLVRVESKTRVAQIKPQNSDEQYSHTRGWLVYLGKLGEKTF